MRATTETESATDAWRQSVLVALSRCDGGEQDGRHSPRCAVVSSRAMFTFSTEPRVAEQQMHAIIYYLTAFGYIDQDFDASEKQFIRDYIAKLVDDRARSVLGDDPALRKDVVGRWTEHFHEVFNEIDREVQEHFTESVAEGESTEQFVLAKLKLRCFELFRKFDDAGREALLTVADELIMADGQVHPNEQAFRDEMHALVTEPVELDDDAVQELVPGAATIVEPVAKETAQDDHPFFRPFEFDYARDPEVFARQSAADVTVIESYLDNLQRQRDQGAGKLAGRKDFGDVKPGERFLDGHVYVLAPEANKQYELLVLGDLHGCYSCLKAALLQADFFRKVQAFHDDPANNPDMKLVLLGDYIDRGRFSYNGILRTVLQLYNTAPDHVFALRGNHEYYVEINGRVMAPVRPAEAMHSLQDVASGDLFAEYMRLFEALPNTLVFDRMLFVHAGIPRDSTMDAKFKDLSSLNDPEVRFEMLWSDPSEADFVPDALQKANARFPFGRKQFHHFMRRLGLRSLVRGHERVVSGFARVYDDPEGLLVSLFSAGGKTNNDLPPQSNYREVTPMALTVRWRDGVSELQPFALDYAKYNDPRYNAFFKERLTG
jgi:hypothetical protein